MSDRLAEIGAHIQAVERLGSVVGAMRGIAAARVRQADAQARAVDRYSATIHDALAEALGDGPPVTWPEGRSPALVVFLAEQGFAGAFSERVLETLGPVPERLWFVGTRGAAMARERGLTPWRERAMPSRGAAIPRLADGMARTLLAAGCDRVETVFPVIGADGRQTTERSLLFPVSPARGKTGPAPLTNLDPAQLLPELLAEALHAGLCRAALHAFAAENMARMLAMGAAQQQTAKRLDGLRAEERRVRQDTITAEIIELAAGEAAARQTAARRQRET